MSHYSIGKIESVADLRAIFPEAKADSMNLVLFSTSGVHGSYTSVEDIERGLKKYGEDYQGEADDWFGQDLTVCLIHPRLVCMRYGNVHVTLDDIEFLKALRASSIEAVSQINAEDNHKGSDEAVASPDEIN